MLTRLSQAIVALQPHRRIRVAIDGVDGAGKTMMADALAPLIAAGGRPAIRASVDDFHNPRAIRYARGRHSPDGFFLDSYDYKAFCGLLLDPFGTEGSGRFVTRHFDYRTDQSVTLQPQKADPGAALIVDGIFLHRHELRGYWDLSIFLQVDVAVSLARNAAREGMSQPIDQSMAANARYVGGQRRYLAECTPAQAADIVIDYNDFEAPAVLKWSNR